MSNIVYVEHLYLFDYAEMNVGVNKQMAPPVPPAKTCGGKKEVRLNSMPWFHGKITREEAETLLKAQTAPDGTFLVRESTNFPGDYTLCVCYQKKVEHYRVIAKVSINISAQISCIFYCIIKGKGRFY